MPDSYVVKWKQGIVGVAPSRKTMGELKQTDRIFENVLQGITDPVLLLSKEYKILWANQAFQNQTGYKIEEIIGSYCYKVTHHQEFRCQPPYDICPISESEKTGRTATTRHIHFDKEGNKIFVEVSAYPLKDEKGEIFQFVYIYRDITEIKRGEEALRKAHDELEIRVEERTAKLQKSERKYRMLIEQASDGIVIVDKQLNFVDVNTMACQMSGFTREELLGLNVIDLIPQDELVKNPMPLDEILEGEIVREERIIKRKDGKVISVEVGAKMLDDGNIQAFIRDVTERKKAEEAVRGEQQRFFSLLESLPAYVCLLTPNYTFSYVNREFRKRFGDPGNRHCYEFLFDRQEPCEGCQTFRVFAEHKAMEWEWSGPDGNTYMIYDYPFTDIDGFPLILELGLDITERKDLEKRDRVSNNLMELFATKHTRKEYIDSTVQVIQKWCGCHCVGIRIVNSEGYIPYESFVGFSREFMELENMLSLKRDICACIRIIAGNPEVQDTAVMTPDGSFFLNNAFKFINELTEKERARYRGNCVQSGFASIAIIPIRYREKTLGAIHLTDEREGMVPLRGVQFIETIAPMIGEAIFRFNTEEVLRKSEKSLSEAQRLAHLGNWDWNIKTNQLYWSDEIYNIFGLSPQQFGATYDAFLDSVHPDDRESVKKAVNEALYEKKPYSIDHRIVLPDGAVRIVHELGEVTFDDTGKSIRMLGTVQDITDIKRAEEELKKSYEQLRNLSAHLQSVREEERANVAREIHDELGQALTALKIDLSMLTTKLYPDHKPLLEKAGSMTERIDETIQTVKKICTELRPTILDHFGLSAAIEWQAKDFERRSGIICNVSVEPEEIILDQDTSTAVFRIFQEALTNVARHANATEVEVGLKEQNDMLVLKVKDNGKGITEQQISKSNSFGLLGVKERVHFQGGNVVIKGVRNKGTTVTVSIPIKKEEKG